MIEEAEFTRIQPTSNILESDVPIYVRDNGSYVLVKSLSKK